MVVVSTSSGWRLVINDDESDIRNTDFVDNIEHLGLDQEV